MSRDSFANGSGRRTTPFTTVKMAVVAPMLSASVRIAAAVSDGRARSARAADAIADVISRITMSRSCLLSKYASAEGGGRVIPPTRILRNSQAQHRLLVTERQRRGTNRLCAAYHHCTLRAATKYATNHSPPVLRSV